MAASKQGNHDDRAATAREAAVAARIGQEQEAQAKRAAMRSTTLGAKLSTFAGKAMTFLVSAILCLVMLFFMAALVIFAYGLLARAIRSAF